MSALRSTPLKYLPRKYLSRSARRPAPCPPSTPTLASSGAVDHARSHRFESRHKYQGVDQFFDVEALKAGALGAELADGTWLVEGTNAGPRRPEEGLDRAEPPPVSGAAAIVDFRHVNL